MPQEPQELSESLIFLSYAREDSYSAERIYRDLRFYGLNVWWDRDRRSIIPGKDWNLEIRKAIKSSRWFVALLSSNSISKKGVVQREIKHALDVLGDLPEDNNFLIPVRLDPCEPSYDLLRQRQWVDMFPDWGVGLSQLLEAFGVSTESVSDQAMRLRRAMGLFRHALIGPVQGLVSAAQMLAQYAEESAPQEAVDKLRDRVSVESELIRLWRYNYQYTDTSSLHMRMRSEAIIPVVRRVIHRYGAGFRDRRLRVEFRCDLQENQRAVFDSMAIDVALSNLLDHAAKFAFYDTPITVHVTVEADTVQVKVDYIGPDPELTGNVTRSGSRTDYSDLVSQILEGNDLGLHAVRSIAKAHEGEFQIQAALLNDQPEPDAFHRQRFSIRFSLVLPFSSTQGGSRQSGARKSA